MPVKPDCFIILTPGFPPNESDTNCLPTVQAFVSCLQEQYEDCIIKVISVQYPFRELPYQWKNIEVIPINGQNKNRWHRLQTWLKAIGKLAHLHSRYRITGILSFWCGECALIGSWFSKIARVKHRCWISGQDAQKDNKYVKWSLLKPDELVAMSDFLQTEFYKNHHIQPAIVIPNGINIKTIPPRQVTKKFDLMAAGSLIELKRFDRFILLVEHLKAVFPNIRAVLCGGGPLDELLKSMIIKHGLTENILMTGEVTHDEVLRLMAGTKLFIHTSSYEGFGVVCLEALATGAAVISFHKPMQQQVHNWFHVSSEEEMAFKAIATLKNSDTKEPVVPYTMHVSVQKMMALFSISTPKLRLFVPQ